MSSMIYPQEVSSAGLGAIVGTSPKIRLALEQVEQVAPTDATVLLLGDTGTGKELFARHLHHLSARRNREMVCVNCAAIPSTLLESELFGCERGAFTDAGARRIGRFELANHSTLFLDEIGDLPAEAQVKLLRVIEDHEIERLGGSHGIPVNVRIVAATHRDLQQRIDDGVFRDDLFYRLNVFPIRIPPLRERAEDIPALVWHFVEQYSKSVGRTFESIPSATMARLQAHHWPGNIRELRNVVERAMIVASGPELVIPLPTAPVARVAPCSSPSAKLVDVQKQHIRSVLETAHWRIRGPGGAADQLGLRPTTLETRMAKLGLTRPSAP